jgi:hypothetical protein
VVPSALDNFIQQGCRKDPYRRRDVLRYLCPDSSLYQDDLNYFAAKEETATTDEKTEERRLAAVVSFDSSVLALWQIPVGAIERPLVTCAYPGPHRCHH